MCVRPCMHINTACTTHRVNLILPSVSKARTQVIGLGSMCLYLRGHLPNPGDDILFTSLSPVCLPVPIPWLSLSSQLWAQGGLLLRRYSVSSQGSEKPRNPASLFPRLCLENVWWICMNAASSCHVHTVSNGGVDDGTPPKPPFPTHGYSLPKALLTVPKTRHWIIP